MNVLIDERCANVYVLYIDTVLNPIIVYRALQSDWLRCDCRLRWMVTWLKFSKVQLDDTVVCKFPPSMNGQRLNQLDTTQLHCG